MSAPIVEPSACTWCGIAWRGHGRQYADAVGWHEWVQPSQEQTLARMKARRLALTVAKQGALPMPAGPAPVALSGPVCSQAEARAAGLDIAPSVEELDAMAESVAALGDPLSAEVSLARAVPLLGAAVTSLRARIAELEAERTEAACPCPPAGRPHQVGCPLDGVPDAVTRVFAPVASLREPEGEFHAWLHHENRVSHDLPETGGAGC